ncbi:hypothetical protein TCAL_14700 [Tigriopus californicus]|uniref:Uncharacterized protein n=1 Tax=Tigriopus californicus TaxID=6832 RepID=A0A553PH06_TIGCA|nr:hypothetical protein TCAL_14700 [Tigriopus californicus]
MEEIRNRDQNVLDAAAQGQTDFILGLLEQENGPDSVNALKDQDGRTVLHLAAANGFLETVAALTLHGADVNAQDFTSNDRTSLRPHSSDIDAQPSNHTLTIKKDPKAEG